jgi:protein-S-isoprenylcysteine O-methyltransferase Ste14
MPAHTLAVVVILNLWIIWIVIWFVSAFFAKRTVYRQPWRQRVMYLGIGLVVWAIIHFMPLTVLSFRLPFAGPVTDVIGASLCALGLAFSVWARFHLGRNWSGTVTIKEDHQLIQTGPYRWVRHPIYTGVLLAVVGTFLALVPSFAGLVGMAVLVAAFSFKLRQEERVMTNQFPDAYPAYKKRVRGALIPYLI